MTEDQLREFLDTEFRVFDYGPRDDRSFREWLSLAIVGLLDEKRVTGCDSGWQWSLYEALAILDPKVGDLELIRRYWKADDASDWEVADNLRDEAQATIDPHRAQETFKGLVEHLLGVTA